MAWCPRLDLMRRACFLLLLLFTTACSFAHEYRSGEVPRLQTYDQEELAGVLRPCEFVSGDLRRDARGESLFVPTGVAEGPNCSEPFLEYLLTLRKGRPPVRAAVSKWGPGEGAVVTDDGLVLGRQRLVGEEVFFDFAGGPTIKGYVEVHRDQGGAPYYSAWHDPEGTEVAALGTPRRVVARSPLLGRLFSRGSRHYLCGWTRPGSREGACDVFDSDEAGGSWRAAGRRLFGDHYVVDMDPESNLSLVAQNRDDLGPLLFTVDLRTWEWKYIGAGPSSNMLFMNVDPLGRPQTRTR
jgi:hypothetical protein